MAAWYESSGYASLLPGISYYTPMDYPAGYHSFYPTDIVAPHAHPYDPYAGHAGVAQTPPVVVYGNYP
jgi:hypothetical protein